MFKRFCLCDCTSKLAFIWKCYFGMRLFIVIWDLKFRVWLYVTLAIDWKLLSMGRNKKKSECIHLKINCHEQWLSYFYCIHRLCFNIICKRLVNLFLVFLSTTVDIPYVDIFSWHFFVVVFYTSPFCVMWLWDLMLRVCR